MTSASMSEEAEAEGEKVGIEDESTQVSGGSENTVVVEEE